MTQQQISFLNTIAPIAVRQAAKHGGLLYPSVTIAQAAHESGWGTSKKMVAANALYGIKVGKSAWKFGTAWKGASYKTGTTEYYDGKNPSKIVDYFRAYANLEDATEDYMDMLSHCNRYKAALGCKTPKDSINAIVAGGYATGLEYAKRIMEIINGNNLLLFDTAQVENVYEQISDQWEIGKTYTTQQDLLIRKEADGDFVLWEDITDSAKKKAFLSDGHPALKKNTRVTVKEIKKIGATTWLRIPSGWICGKNSKNVYVQ